MQNFDELEHEAQLISNKPPPLIKSDSSKKQQLISTQVELYGAIPQRESDHSLS